MVLMKRSRPRWWFVRSSSSSSSRLFSAAGIVVVVASLAAVLLLLHLHHPHRHRHNNNDAGSSASAALSNGSIGSLLLFTSSSSSSNADRTTSRTSNDGGGDGNGNNNVVVAAQRPPPEEDRVDDRNNKKIKKYNNNKDQVFGACLKIMDDNHVSVCARKHANSISSTILSQQETDIDLLLALLCFLPYLFMNNQWLVEWLAYHWFVLPLRHLVVLIDPKSRTSPVPILERWSNAGYMEVEYADGTLYDGARAQNLAAAKGNVEHLGPQRAFLADCMRRYKRTLNWTSWVLMTDTDEVRGNNWLCSYDARMIPQVSSSTGIRVTSALILVQLLPLSSFQRFSNLLFVLLVT